MQRWARVEGIAPTWAGILALPLSSSVFIPLSLWGRFPYPIGVGPN
jgi:hypothetical protein